jgi:hypothetical protein
MWGRAMFRAGILFLAAYLAVVATAAAEPGQTSSEAAPLDQYLMADRAGEIALARSAAPPSISGNASVMVLDRGGYVPAGTGSNGFTCLVLRSWTAGFSDPIFWDARVRGPVCYNPSAVRSVLPQVLERAQWVMAGLPKAEMQARARTSPAVNRAPEPGSFGYMMSKDQFISTGANPHWHPHLMFYQAHATSADWGADLPGSPVFSDVEDAVTLYFIPLSKWSDGSSAMPDH